MTPAEQLARNTAANETYIQQHYSKEKFISDIPRPLSANKYIKGLVIPKNIKVAESRLPTSREQREVLRKELRQAEILAKMGNSVYLIPEHHVHGVNITGNITRNEATHVFGKVLRRKPEYSGKIIISFNEGRNTYFWESNSLR